MTTLLSLTLAADDPLAHVVNAPALTIDGWWAWSSTQGNLLLTGIIMCLGGAWLLARIGPRPGEQGGEAFVTRNPLAHTLEVICLYLRDEVARPLLRDRTDKLMPFLWTVFFFILINNLLGLTPITDLLHALGAVLGVHIPPVVGGTATQNIWVTGSLALIAAVVFNGAAILRLGPVGFVQHMMGGLPWYMFPIALLLLVIEAAGQFIIKPFALALRLFANMTAGHVLIATLLAFAGSALASIARGSGVGGGLVTLLVSSLSIFALTLLELFVAFLQAFVFMFLTAIFISLMDHHDEHAHAHEHGHAPGHEHAHA